MFILRSAFWLTLAFLVMAPKSVDLGAAAGDLSGRAVAAGQQLVVDHLLADACASAECLGAKALVAVTRDSSRPVGPTMQDSPTGPLPHPRPRPDWLG